MSSDKQHRDSTNSIWRNGDFQFFIAVIVVLVVIVCGILLFNLLHRTQNAATEERNLEMVKHCTAFDTPELQESCVNAILKIDERDPVSLRIETLEEELKEIKDDA